MNSFTAAGLKTIPRLSLTFALVPPAALLNKHPTVPPTEGPVRPNGQFYNEEIVKEHQWL